MIFQGSCEYYLIVRDDRGLTREMREAIYFSERFKGYFRAVALFG